MASLETFEAYPFSKEALLLAKNHGFKNIVITNQSKIGKGILPRETYDKEAARILTNFNSDCVLLDEFLCCPHTNEDNCNCKKPKIGLMELCREKYDLDIEKSFVIGDMGKNEIVMAHNAGCKGVLVLTGGGRKSLGEFRHTWAEHEADIIAENALEAVKMILRK